MGEIPSSPFVITKMVTFWESLSEPSKANWAEIYKKLTSRDWKPPAQDKRAIQCEPKIEDISEIDKLMRQSPNYSIDVQGRER